MSIRGHMTTTRKNGRRSTRSSSSPVAAKSKRRREVLELGRQIVEEIGHERGLHQSTRWLAHHLAELITDSQSATEANARRKAADQAVDVILRVWEHRTRSGVVSPFSDLEKPIQILRSLSPDDRFSGFFSARSPS